MPGANKSLINKLSIRHKLLLIIAIVGIASLALSAVTLHLKNKYQMNSVLRFVSNLTYQSSSMEASSIADLKNNNVVAANNLLKEMVGQSQTAAAYLLDKQGKIFAEYSRRDESIPGDIKRDTSQASFAVNGSDVDFYYPVFSGDDQLGLIYFRENINAAAGEVIGIFEVALILAVMIIFISLWLRSMIISPLTHLSKLMDKVSTGNDFSIRANKISNDEIGKLADGFNHMISQIEIFRNSERQKNQEKLKHLAYYDGLTDIPNRVYSLQLIEQAIKEVKAYQQLLSIMFIDVDKFKLINDRLGHQAGDELLKQLAKRFNDCLRATDDVILPHHNNTVLARFGGDEFIVLAKNVQCPENVKIIANRLLDQSKRPYLLNGKEVHIGVSIGAALYPKDGHNLNDLMKNADIAMYISKTHGRNQFHLFQPGMVMHGTVH